MQRIRLVLATLLASAFLGCSATEPSPAVLHGTWGGEHVSLTATRTSSHFEFDCAIFQGS
jgi:hypothetical protein